MRRVVLPIAVLALAALPPLTAAASAPTAEAAKRKVRILCLDKAGSHTVFRKAPAKCAAFGPGGTFGGGVNLAHLRWKHFGRRTATARGRELGFHQPYENVKVRVRAYRLRNGCRGTRVYTRLKATSSTGSVTARLPRCPGPA